MASRSDIRRLLVIAALGLLSSAVSLSPPLLHDAVAGASGLVPLAPGIGVTSTPPLANNSINLGTSGGQATINFEGKDQAAAAYPGSLQIGIYSNGKCLTTGAGLPTGAQATYTNNPAVNPSILAKGTISWAVPANTPTTTIDLCALNTFWVNDNGITIRHITVSTGSLVSSVTVSSAIYDAKTRTLAVKGKVKAARSNISLKGTTVTIEDFTSGQTVATGLVVNNGFNIKTKTLNATPPAVSVAAIAANTLSPEKTVKIIGKVSEDITVKIPTNDGVVINNTYTYQLTATDTLGNPVSFRLASAPPGLTISPGGLVTWTATSSNSTLGQKNSYTIVVTSSSGFTKTVYLGIGVCPQGTYWMDEMGGMCM